MTRWLATAALCALPAVAFAGAFRPVPEPETLSLIALGAVALVIARTRKRK